MTYGFGTKRYWITMSWLLKYSLCLSLKVLLSTCKSCSISWNASCNMYVILFIVSDFELLSICMQFYPTYFSLVCICNNNWELKIYSIGWEPSRHYTYHTLHLNFHAIYSQLKMEHIPVILNVTSPCVGGLQLTQLHSRSSSVGLSATKQWFCVSQFSM